MKFKLLSLFCVVTVIAFVLAGLTSEIEAVRKVTIAILAINACGLLAGVVVTYVLKFPRDGSYRHEAFVSIERDSMSKD